jgi:hypothetical protein
MRAAVMAVAWLAVVGCSKSEPAPAGAGGDAAPGKIAVVEGGAGGEAGAGGDAGSGTGTGTGTGTGKSYAGKYSVAVGAMYVPDAKDWSSVKFKNDDSKMLGDGEMKIEVDPSGRVSGGTEGGPLGASVLDGQSDGTTLTATVRRKDPTDEGLTGTLEAKISGDAIEGTMKLAESNAAVVRVGKLEAKKK